MIKRPVSQQTLESDEMPDSAAPKAPRSFLGVDIFMYAAFVALAAMFVLVYWRLARQYPRATIDMLVNFRADRPFQYRILTIWFIRLAHSLTGMKATHICFMTTFGATFFTLVVYRKYLELFFTKREAFIGSLAIIYVMLWNYPILAPLYYPYDIPGIFFFVVGLILIYKHKMAWYYPVFLLACLNRESAGFLIAAYLFTTVALRKPAVIALHCVGQLLIWLAVKYAVTVKFAGNPGVSFENHLADNAHFLGQLFRLELNTLPFVFAYGLVWPLILVGWARHPAFVKRLLLTLIPYHIGMYIVANLWETRQYSEMIPVLLTPALMGARSLLSRLPVPREAS